MTSLFENVDIVKSAKNSRIPSETTLQHSYYDRERQIYLLKDVNRYTYTFSNSMDVRRRILIQGKTTHFLNKNSGLLKL